MQESKNPIDDQVEVEETVVSEARFGAVELAEAQDVQHFVDGTPDRLATDHHAVDGPGSDCFQSAAAGGWHIVAGPLESVSHRLFGIAPLGADVVEKAVAAEGSCARHGDAREYTGGVGCSNI